MASPPRRISTAAGLALMAGLACLEPLLSPAPLGAQVEPPSASPSPSLYSRGLSVGVGFRRLNQADDLVSPLRYGGYSWGASVGFAFPTPGSHRDLRLSYSASDLTSSLTQGGRHREKGHWADLRATVLRTVKSFRQGTLSLRVGGALTGRLALYEHWYTEEDSETWSHVFTLVEPGAGWHLSLGGGGSLSQEVTIPLAGMAIRPPYQGFTEVPKPRWVGPGAVEGIHQALRFWRPYGSRWGWGITYTYEGLRYGEPRPLAWTRHSLSFQVTYPGGRP